MKESEQKLKEEIIYRDYIQARYEKHKSKANEMRLEESNKVIHLLVQEINYKIWKSHTS